MNVVSWNIFFYSEKEKLKLEPQVTDACFNSKLLNAISWLIKTFKKNHIPDKFSWLYMDSISKLSFKEDK